VTVRPYKSEHDNHFETACLCALLYGYFASVLAGALAQQSASLDASAAVCKLAVVLYSAGRVLRERCGQSCGQKWSRVAAGRDGAHGTAQSLPRDSGDAEMRELAQPLMSADAASAASSAL
jgi:hypothetical protein